MAINAIDVVLCYEYGLNCHSIAAAKYGIVVNNLMATHIDVMKNSSKMLLSQAIFDVCNRHMECCSLFVIKFSTSSS